MFNALIQAAVGKEVLSVVTAQCKIVVGVVLWINVDVVNYFRVSKVTADSFLHYEPMLRNEVLSGCRMVRCVLKYVTSRLAAFEFCAAAPSSGVGTGHEHVLTLAGAGSTVRRWVADLVEIASRYECFAATGMAGHFHEVSPARLAAIQEPRVILAV